MKDVLEARKLVLRGPDGDVQVEIEATVHGPRAALHHGGDERIVLRATTTSEGDPFSSVRIDGPGEGGLSLHAVGNRFRIGMFTQADDGDCLEFIAEVSPDDDAPRLRFIGKNRYGEPALELPGPTWDGRFASHRRRLLELLREIVREGDYARRELDEMIHRATFELSGFERGGEYRPARGPQPVEDGREGGMG